MSKIPWYVFVLIALFLLLVYYRGAGQLGQVLFAGTSNIISLLQGRTQSGTVVPYASGN